MAKYSGLGPKDQLTAQSRLDWVKTIDGKQVAQITNTTATIYHEPGNVEEDMQTTSTELVDLASGITTHCDESGSSKYITPPTEATQMTGGTEFTFHADVLSDAATAPPAKP